MNRNGRRFVFQALGSRGDVAPLLEIAGELARRGHACDFLANAAYHADAQAAGVRFSSITSQTEIFTGAGRSDADHFLFACLAPIRQFFREQVQNPDDVVVVNADRNHASNLMAEWLGIRVVRAVLTPFKVVSRTSPPWPFGRNGSGFFPHTHRTYALRKLYDSVQTEPHMLAAINRRRARVGLPHVESAWYPEPYVRRHVALFPDWYGCPDEDWPYRLRCVGFPLAKRTGVLPEALRRFLEGNERPIVFTPGTCAPAAAEVFFRQAKACCDELRTRAVVLTPYVPASLRNTDPRILCLDFVDLGEILPEAALIVHHGGIGTTAQALRAGIPQIVLPRAFDQPDNGRRVERLGVGAAIDPATLAPGVLADAIRRLLGRVDLSARLRAVRALAQDDGAVPRAADILESVAHEGRSLTARVRSSKRRVLVVASPGANALLAPVALARALVERGDTVFIGTEARGGALVRELGFDWVDISGSSDWGQRWTVFDELPSDAAFGEAIERLSVTIENALERCRPSLVLLDSRYSPLGVVLDAKGVRWALFEDDLPPELDVSVPPPSCAPTASPTPATSDATRAAWRAWLKAARCADPGAVPADVARSLARRDLSIRAVRALRARYGASTSFDRSACDRVVARVPRMVFTAPELDFDRRTRSAARVDWVGPCIDQERSEAHFPWASIPAQAAVVYAAIGPESARRPGARRLVSALLDVFASANDELLVLHCPSEVAAMLPRTNPNAIVVHRAPRLALLRRARAAVVEAEFNVIKECAAYGVPTLAAVLHDGQLRNAILVARRGIGSAFDAREAADPKAIAAELSRLEHAAGVRGACDRIRAALRAVAGTSRAVAFVDRMMREAPRHAATAAPRAVTTVPRRRDCA